MNNEKRTGENAVPDNLNKYLNDAQLSELHTIESFGWEVYPLNEEKLDAFVNFMSRLEKKN